EDNEYFRNRVLQRPDHPNRNMGATKVSHRRIEEAADRVQKHVLRVIKPLSDEGKVAQLREWVKFIESRAKVILLKVPNDLDAFVMFETLNDRGLKTSQADLVKNFLFNQANDRITEAQKKWTAMLGALESTGVDDIVMTYLRHYLSSLYGLTRDKV